jgi:hypothetical protein
MRVTLVHTLKHSIAPIEASFARLWPDARLMNLLAVLTTPDSSVLKLKELLAAVG